jgi:hypothetical protein
MGLNKMTLKVYPASVVVPAARLLEDDADKTAPALADGDALEDAELLSVDEFPDDEALDEEEHIPAALSSGLAAAAPTGPEKKPQEIDTVAGF